MTLNELAAATGLTANDLIGIWDAEASGSTEPTQKLTAQQLAAAVKVLADLVGTAELAEKQDKLTFDTTPTTGSNNPVTSGGVATAIQQSTALSTLMTATSGAGANDNPATYTPGLYSLAGSSYDTSYWPTSNLYGILIIWDTAYYREALFLGSANSPYKGHVSKTASPLVFAWRTITTT